MLFHYLNLIAASDAIRRALKKTIQQKYLTRDLARLMPSAKRVSTSRFTEQIVKNL